MQGSPVGNGERQTSGFYNTGGGTLFPPHLHPNAVPVRSHRSCSGEASLDCREGGRTGFLAHKNSSLLPEGCRSCLKTGSSVRKDRQAVRLVLHPTQLPRRRKPPLMCSSDLRPRHCSQASQNGLVQQVPKLWVRDTPVGHDSILGGLGN